MCDNHDFTVVEAVRITSMSITGEALDTATIDPDQFPAAVRKTVHFRAKFVEVELKIGGNFQTVVLLELD